MSAAGLPSKRLRPPSRAAMRAAASPGVVVTQTTRSGDTGARRAVSRSSAAGLKALQPTSADQIYPVFRDLFKKEGAQPKAA